MSSTEPLEREASRPTCPRCGVAMWLREVQHNPGPHNTDRWYFECKVCGDAAVIPPLD
jgi:predicted RNA-binding Zn-ribbon protein involved in translation (DUF1610 family)